MHYISQCCRLKLYLFEEPDQVSDSYTRLLFSAIPFLGTPMWVFNIRRIESLRLSEDSGIIFSMQDIPQPMRRYCLLSLASLSVASIITIKAVALGILTTNMGIGIGVIFGVQMLSSLYFFYTPRTIANL